MTNACELLTTDQMYAADRAAMSSGVAGVRLMEAAGYAVALEVAALRPEGRIAVLCGPGNNGGDGFVAARHLRTWGYDVALALLGETAKLKGDAAAHAAVWGGEVETLSSAFVESASVVVDALFGAGLTRPLAGAAAEAVRAVNASAARVVAVDVPSGISGDSGEVVGDLAVAADRTVTFFRAKPGHYLYPGRRLCGEVRVADIGIPGAVLSTIEPLRWCNDPRVWGHLWPWRHGETHKYRHGHALVLGGGRTTGAGRLSAHAALRAGAGLVTVAAPPEALPTYAAESASLMTRALGEGEALGGVLSDPRRNAVLIGPGAGVTAETRTRTLDLLSDGRAVVLDADALSVFEGDVAALVDARRGAAVLTPHEGEFRRLFPDLEGDKATRAAAAAERTGAVVVLKGADSVIAAPDGRLVFDAGAPADLATAGSGDVLAGIVVGVLAQGVPAFEAACAAVWLLGRAARGLGPGLISADLPPRLPEALAALSQALRD
jgi:NAD(P)H-hydrate epimerase